jgi:hypothetical protein
MGFSSCLFSLLVDRDLTRLRECVLKSSSGSASAVNTGGSLLGLPFEQHAKKATHVFGDFARVLFCEWSRTAAAPDVERSRQSLVG